MCSLTDVTPFQTAVLQHRNYFWMHTIQKKWKGFHTNLTQYSTPPLLHFDNAGKISNIRLEL
jgi:hypothetical protein